MKTGIYHFSDSEYHADPCPEPSLSASIAKLLVSRPPIVARDAHPRLNRQYVAEEKAAFDLGTAAHAMLLQVGGEVVEISADSWRTKDAKEKRDEARAAGKVPLLSKDVYRTRAMCDAAVAQLHDHQVTATALDGLPERTLVWQEEGVWMRCKLDLLPIDDDGQFVGSPPIIYDYKTTGDVADPAMLRQAFRMDWAVQEEFYRRGFKAVFDVEPVFRFIVQETTPPHLLSVIELDNTSRAIGRSKVDHALAVFKECSNANVWPGYPGHVATLDTPAWYETGWNEREHKKLGDPLTFTDGEPDWTP